MVRSQVCWPPGQSFFPFCRSLSRCCGELRRLHPILCCFSGPQTLVLSHGAATLHRSGGTIHSACPGSCTARDPWRAAGTWARENALQWAVSVCVSKSCAVIPWVSEVGAFQESESCIPSPHSITPF